MQDLRFLVEAPADAVAAELAHHAVAGVLRVHLVGTPVQQIRLAAATSQERIKPHDPLGSLDCLKGPKLRLVSLASAD